LKHQCHSIFIELNSRTREGGHQDEPRGRDWGHD
jgi:hypothetical protein